MSTSRLRRGANIRSINRERYHGPDGAPRVMKTLCEKSVGRRKRPRRTSLRLVNWPSRRLLLRYCVRHGRSSGSTILDRRLQRSRCLPFFHGSLIAALFHSLGAGGTGVLSSEIWVFRQ